MMESKEKDSLVRSIGLDIGVSWTDIYRQAGVSAPSALKFASEPVEPEPQSAVTRP